jgi:hypothetical protein
MVPQMASEISFGRIIRTSAKAQPHFPMSVETVEQALDHLQELPLATWWAGHWRTASLALWGAVDYPGDTVRLTAADRALCAALAKEEWLDEISPA